MTRPEGQAGALEAALHAVGFDVVAVALTRVEPVAGALPERRPGDVVAFTSANAARALFERGALGWLAGAEVVAVGPATAAALRELGVPPTMIPATATGAGLAAALGPGRRVLHPRAEEALDSLREGVEASGGEYVAAPVYRLVPNPEAAEAVAAALPVDVIPLGSPSAARALVALGLDLGAARVVVIGPTTAAACRALGLSVAAVATEASAAGLAEGAAREAQARIRQ
ncbi:MAG: hydroxymethylbilane synthase [Pseudomonadota bacterium]